MTDDEYEAMVVREKNGIAPCVRGSCCVVDDSPRAVVTPIAPPGSADRMGRLYFDDGRPVAEGRPWRSTGLDGLESGYKFP